MYLLFLLKSKVFTGLLTLGLAVILGYYESVFKPLVHLVMHDIPINTTGTVVSDAVSFAASLSATSIAHKSSDQISATLKKDSCFVRCKKYYRS